MRLKLAAAFLFLSASSMAMAFDRSPVPPANPKIAPAVASQDWQPQVDLSMPESLPGALQKPAPAQAASLVPAPVLEAPHYRPKARPKAIETAAVKEAEAEAAQTAAQNAALAEALVQSSIRPAARPASVTKAAARRAAAPAEETASPGAIVAVAAKPKKETTSKKGSVCGVAAIKGEPIAAIKGKVNGCGLADGVRVTSVSGVRLSMAATIDCTTAKALNAWVEGALQPAYGQKVVELKIAGHYVCRPRNNKAGAKISEHGRGRAIDISGIVLANGTVKTVLKNYDKTMRAVHKKACGLFGTTLGPGSDGYHEDHLHFDTANRNNPYCR